MDNQHSMTQTLSLHLQYTTGVDNENEKVSSLCDIP